MDREKEKFVKQDRKRLMPLNLCKNKEIAVQETRQIREKLVESCFEQPSKELVTGCA